MARVPDEDELIEHWTLVGDELDLLIGRTGPSKLGLRASRRRRFEPLAAKDADGHTGPAALPATVLPSAPED